MKSISIEKNNDRKWEFLTGENLDSGRLALGDKNAFERLQKILTARQDAEEIQSQSISDILPQGSVGPEVPCL